MNDFFLNKLKVVLFLSTIFFCKNLFAQKLIELLPGSDSLVYNKELNAQVLKGNVEFTYEGVVMYCDSAYYFEKKQEIKAYSNIHLNQNDTLNLYCDSLYYSGRLNLAKLWGNVRFRDMEYKLETDSLDYNTKTKYAVYKNGGVITSINSDEKLTSKLGYYYPNSKNFFFKKNVNYFSQNNTVNTDTLKFISSLKIAYFYGPTHIYNDSNYIYCEKGLYDIKRKEAKISGSPFIENKNLKFKADSIYYNSQKKIGKGFKNVIIRDTSNNTIYKSNYAYTNDSTGYSILTDSAIAMQIHKLDTFYLHADTIQALKKDSSTNINAFYKVKFLNSELQGQCDSLFYSNIDSLIKMYNNPILWNEKNQITGDSIFLKIHKGKMQKVNVFNNAFVISEIDSIGYYNQIYGRNIVGFFKKNKLKKVWVKGNAKTIYYPENKSQTDSSIIIKRTGMNRVYCSSIRIELDSNTISKIIFIDNPEATFYPIEKINSKEQFIDGFKWLYYLKPKTWRDLFD